MKYGTLGSVSTGTLRDQDLIDTFADALRPLATRANTAPQFKLCDDADKLWRRLDDGDDSAMDEASDMVSELIDALNEYAPPFCYFGSHEGDGADFGFWFSSDAFEDACRNGECLKVSDLGEASAQLSPGTDLPEFVAVVSDHGNVTVYARYGFRSEKGEK